VRAPWRARHGLTRCVHPLASGKKPDRRLLTRRISQKAMWRNATSEPFRRNRKPSRSLRHPHGCDGLREGHFAGGVQEKNPNDCEDLNTIETKGVDACARRVIAPSRSLGTGAKSPPGPVGVLWVFVWSHPVSHRGGRDASENGNTAPSRLSGPDNASTESPDGRISEGDREVSYCPHKNASASGPFKLAIRSSLLHTLWITCGVRHTSRLVSRAAQLERYDVGGPGWMSRTQKVPRRRAARARVFCGVRCLRGSKFREVADGARGS
jgi:hypothetical protein